MKSLWNYLVLDRPPTVTWTPNRGEFDISSFVCAINKILKDLSYQELLHIEAAILSRLIYRMKWKFRSDKGLKNMEKTNRALLNYLKLAIEKEFIYLKENVDIEKPSTVPSRQMLEYVLIRIQGFVKLMCRVESVAKKAAEFLKCRINVGQAWMVATIAYSVISRIWLISRHLVKKSCNWYNSLYPFIHKLRLIGVEWMPKDQELPPNLKIWLNISWIDEPIQCITEGEMSDSIFKLIKPSDNDDLLEPDKSMIVDEVETNESTLNVIKSEGQDSKPPRNTARTLEVKTVDFDAIPDTGEKISRESFTSQQKSKKKYGQEKSKPKEHKIDTKEDLSRLLALDSYPGLNKFQWNILKKKISKTVVKLEKLPVKSAKHKLLMEKIVRSIRDSVS